MRDLVGYVRSFNVLNVGGSQYLYKCHTLVVYMYIYMYISSYIHIYIVVCICIYIWDSFRENCPTDIL